MSDDRWLDADYIREHVKAKQESEKPEYRALLDAMMPGAIAGAIVRAIADLPEPAAEKCENCGASNQDGWKFWDIWRACRAAVGREEK